jgi:hypothetical protein
MFHILLQLSSTKFFTLIMILLRCDTSILLTYSVSNFNNVDKNTFELKTPTVFCNSSYNVTV